MKIIKNKIMKIISEEITKIFEENPEFSTPEEHFRAADDYGYADPREKSQGRALSRDKKEKTLSSVDPDLQKEYDNSEDPMQLLLQKISDIYDRLESNDINR
jgi:hypothetical protein